MSRLFAFYINAVARRLLSRLVLRQELTYYISGIIASIIDFDDARATPPLLLCNRLLMRSMALSATGRSHFYFAAEMPPR